MLPYAHRAVLPILHFLLLLLLCLPWLPSPPTVPVTALQWDRNFAAPATLSQHSIVAIRLANVQVFHNQQHRFVWQNETDFTLQGYVLVGE